MPLDTLEEIIEAIDRNPELRKQIRDRILGDEFLELPPQVATLTATVNELAERVNDLTIKLDNLTVQVNELTVRLDELTVKVNDLTVRLDDLTVKVSALTVTLNEFMETTNKRFEEIDKRFDKVDERFDAIDKRFDEHDKRFDKVDERFDEHDKRFDKVDERFDAIDKRFDEHDNRFDGIDKRFDEHDNRFDRVEGQIARVYDKLNAEFGGAKGRDLENKVMERAFLIPETIEPDLMHVRNLGPSELRALAGPAANISDIPRGHRDSYYFADLVMEASAYDGETCYIAAEISYTCDEGDTKRAIRNAGMLERFTGKRSYAAVIGVSVDDRIRATIDSGAIHWYKLEEELVTAK